MSSGIRMQADDFFDAYQVLADNYDTATLSIMGPSVVCLAFSIELYLKDVYSALNIKIPRSHNILKLYEGLPEQIKQDILAHKAISQNPFATKGILFSSERGTSAYDGFISQIEAISSGFEKWRYSYESGNLQYNTWFALALIKAVKAV